MHMDPVKKRIHRSGSSKRQLSASKALKQAAADPRTLTLYTPQPSVNEGDRDLGIFIVPVLQAPMLKLNNLMYQVASFQKTV